MRIYCDAHRKYIPDRDISGSTIVVLTKVARKDLSSAVVRLAAKRLVGKSVRSMQDCCQWCSQGGEGAIAPPPLFQGERVGGRAICHVVTLGDEQTRRGTGYGD